MSSFKEKDPEVLNILNKELKRQQGNLELIASENFTDPLVMKAQGSVFTNKYAEGYPYKYRKSGELDYNLYGRYYGGCEFIDEGEKLAIERVKKLFGAEHANVQPHSGSQANMAVYYTLLEPGDLVFGLDLSHGGHLTHGHPLSFSGKYFKIFHYTVDPKTEVINYDQLRKWAVEEKPRMIIAGASAYPRKLDFAKFKEIADEVGAYLMVDMAHIAGLIAAGLHENPVPYADMVTSTTHKTLRGPRGGFVLTKEKYRRDLDRVVFPGLQGGPLEHVILAKAVAFKLALEPEFKDYQKKVVDNAKTLAEALKREGFRLVSGGTDTHLMLVDLRPKKVTGKKLEKALDKAGITVNKNTIPFDPEKPFVTSGIRIGTPAMTTRGMGKDEMVKIASFIRRVAENIENEDEIAKVRDEVKELTDQFPLYPNVKYE
ncbi:MAG TPA: serine hydroxymethyltransferase [Firmicutes bacterium]|uniref:Serine hydroxymethyltransferase n=1 Tax=candidate division TA06 bacterium TaxID=2250710 RepID=A0A660S799_UNCT6|nr:MAG: serine hydroxymethyltransferase [candidate division TA06 bacterium]HFD04531.1 serine hydroxymethyltransferase [Bacillota bacterium]